MAEGDFPIFFQQQLNPEASYIAAFCRKLKVETQNINVPACRFYASQGCVLAAVNRMAYREPQDEIQLLWYKDLSDGAQPG
jgi:hypothetical protein